MSLLKLLNVSAQLDFKAGQSSLLQDVNLEIQTGEFVILMGSNAISQTSLLKIIGLLLKPNQGSYILDDQLTDKFSATKMTRLRRRLVGFIFREFHLIPTLSVLDNVSLPLFYSTTLKTGQRRRQAQALLTRLGIHYKSGLYPQQLTFNQQQRIAVARALINDPQLILADHPTAYLDNIGSEIVMNILSSRQQLGNTLILATDNPSLTKYADRILYLDDGRLRINQPLKKGQEVDLNKIKAAIAKQNLKLRSQLANSGQL